MKARRRRFASIIVLSNGKTVMVHRRLLIDFGWANRPSRAHRPTRYVPDEVLIVLNRHDYILLRLVAIGEDWLASLRRHYGSRVAIYDDRTARYQRVRVVQYHSRSRASPPERTVCRQRPSAALRRVWDADARLTEAYERYDVVHAAYIGVRDAGRAPGEWLRNALRRRWAQSVVAEQRAVAALGAYLQGRRELFMPGIDGLA